MVSVKIIDKYDAMSIKAQKELKLKEFTILPRINQTYLVSLDPKEIFIKFETGRMTYWKLAVGFPDGAFPYSERKHDKIIMRAAMGNETLALGKMMASRFRELMERNYKKCSIKIEFTRVTDRTCFMKVI